METLPCYEKRVTLVEAELRAEKAYINTDPLLRPNGVCSGMVFCEASGCRFGAEVTIHTQKPDEGTRQRQRDNKQQGLPRGFPEQYWTRTDTFGRCAKMLETN